MRISSLKNKKDININMEIVSKIKKMQINDENNILLVSNNTIYGKFLNYGEIFNYYYSFCINNIIEKEENINYSNHIVISKKIQYMFIGGQNENFLPFFTILDKFKEHKIRTNEKTKIISSLFLIENKYKKLFIMWRYNRKYINI